MDYKHDIPNFIQELSKAIHNDFNEILEVIESGIIAKKHLGMSDTRMRSFMLDIKLQTIHKILFPEDIKNADDDVDPVILDANFSLLNDFVVAHRWQGLLTNELKETIVSLGDCIQSNFKERQKMLKLIPPNTHLEIPKSKFKPFTPASTPKKASTNIKKKSTISSQSVLIKKKITPQKKAIVKQVELLQESVQPCEKKNVDQSNQELAKNPTPNSD